MQKPSRQELSARLTALAEDALDYVEGTQPDGFDLGVAGIVFEVLIEDEPDGYLKRSDGGYTPEDGVRSYFVTWASDNRMWVKEKLFEEACNVVEYVPDLDDESPGEE